MFKIGDKVLYIGKENYLSETEIFTVYDVHNNWICISEFDTSIKKTLPMWQDKDFISLNTIRKNKLKIIIKNNG